MPRAEYGFKYGYVSFFTFLSVCVCVCVCMRVLQGLVMDSQNGFSQKNILSASYSFDTTSTSFSV